MPFLGELASLSAAALWSVSSLLYARLGQVIGPAALNFFKCGVSLLLLFATRLLLDGAGWPTGLTTNDVLLLTLSGFIGISLGDTAWFASLRLLGARRALLLFTTAPVLTAALATAFLGDPFTWPMALGIGLTLGGVTWVMLERSDPDKPPTDRDGDGGALAFGIAMGGVAALCQAVGSILTRLAGEGLSSLDVSIVRLCIGTLALGVQVALARQLGSLNHAVRTDALRNRLLIATFLGTYLGIWLMNTGLLNAPVGIAATLNSTSPLFVLVLSHFVLRERVTARSALGALIACGGIGVLFLARPA